MSGGKLESVQKSGLHFNCDEFAIFALRCTGILLEYFWSKNVLSMNMITFPNTTRSHQVATVPMMPFDSKSTFNLRSALQFTESLVILFDLGIFSFFQIYFWLSIRKTFPENF